MYFKNGINYFSPIYQLFNNFIFFLTISSIFIAITGASLPYFSLLLYGKGIDVSLILSAFLLTFTVYSLDKLSNIKEDSISLPGRAGFIIKNKKILTYITIASYMVALCISFGINLIAFFVILFPLCMGLVYSIKISNVRLKDIIAVKNITIATSWAVMGTFLPLAVSFEAFLPIALIFYFIFIKCFVNSVVFDVRDIEGDRFNGVITIPVFLGKNKTKYILLILNSTLIIWLVYSYLHGFFHRYLFILSFVIIYGYWYILYFCKERTNRDNSIDLLVDGEFIMIAIAAMIFA